MTDRVRRSPENPWYWSYDDAPVLLLGGTDKDNLSTSQLSLSQRC
ncbi:hypothetical protein [Natronolimnobius sp. AArcel1]|nr:hypothetical protein [Natronolimnobius sp. AArcel1]